MKQKQFRNNNRHENGTMPVSLKSEKLIYPVVKSYSQKFLILLFMILGSYSFSFAQLQWGVKFGTNASTQSEVGNIGDNDGLKIGFNFGIIAKYQMNDWMALKSGLEYQKKGRKYDLAGENSEVKDNLRYLVLPVKAEFSASEKAGFENGQRLFFATGPYLGYLLDAEQKINDETTDLNEMNDVDFGWSFEVGMEFPVFKNYALQVSLNYDMGLMEIADDTDMQNKSASLNLSFLF